MSNFLAVATVTGTLRRVLQAAVAPDVSGATVTTSRPEDSAAGLPITGVNLFLFAATPNPDLRNLDLPTRRGDGSLSALPEEALDLHYMLSFHGDETTLEPQRLLGSVTRTLNAQPILSRQQIEDTLADPAFGFLVGSDLPEAIERVRLVSMGLSPEEQSRIWSGIFTNVPYRLSVMYRASVVLLTAEDEQPSGALPVRRRQLLALPFRQPRIEAVHAASDPRDPIVVGGDVLVTGQRLRADVTQLRLAGQEFDVTDVRDDRIAFSLAAPAVVPSALRAGVQSIQVLHPFLVGVPQEARAGAESNAAPLVLRSTITSVTALNVTSQPGGTVSADIGVEVDPPIGARQRLILLLNPAPGSTATRAHSIRAASRTVDSDSVEIAVSGIEPGDYLVRVQVDGAESVLTADDDSQSPTFEQYIAPVVSVVLP